jgi:hypothetical protein
LKCYMRRAWREREREVGRLSKVSHNKRRYFASSFPFLSRIDVTLVGSVSLHFRPIHEIRGKKTWRLRSGNLGIDSAVMSILVAVRFTIVPCLFLCSFCFFLVLIIPSLFHLLPNSSRFQNFPSFVSSCMLNVCCPTHSSTSVIIYPFSVT